MESLGAILNGDSVAVVGLQALMGRTTQLAVEWGALEFVPGDTKLPIIAVLPLPFEQTGADGDNRRGWVQLTAFAEGNGAQALANSIIARVEQIVTASAFLAQGFDCAPRLLRRLQVSVEREYSRSLHRADVEIELDGMQVPVTL